MQIALGLAFLFLLGCEDKRPAEQRAVEVKEKAVEVAREAANDAKDAMHSAQRHAADAKRRLDAARAELEQAKLDRDEVRRKLDAVRKDAAETIQLADRKLTELYQALGGMAVKVEQAAKDVTSATSDEARAKARSALDRLEQERSDLEKSIVTIEQLKRELEAPAP